MERGRKAFQQNASLRTGATLLKEVPDVVRQEFLEEMACNLSIIPEVERKMSQEPVGMVSDVNGFIGQRETQVSSTRWYMQVQKDFKDKQDEREDNILPESVIIPSQDSLLEVSEEDFMQRGLGPEDMDRATELLRQMYAIDIRLWAEVDSPERTTAEQDKLKFQSDAILVEVNRLVKMWALRWKIRR